MAIQPILRMGDPRLLQKASPVPLPVDEALHVLVQDMRDTMIDADGAGLAAPQIGVGWQVVIYQLENNPRYPDQDPIPFTVLINPQITPLSEETVVAWEGCLSLPGLRGEVARYQHIHLRAFDLEGRLIDINLEGFHARVVQHECDHLSGIVYPMRMSNLARFGYRQELVESGVCG